ncbi:probable cytochrome P450 304a1 [Anopheles ziemanni]|uniref:probable cytochrome P450 304a1 n=1 Tax=Anopheles coustani TaxID=139045 RepID=UPI002658B4E8|nr:probable cytochrome P450 304a1 [Anopheles coustani]XP_058171583.1 probable cytochrome P450 304a1 [Anopheles ziemanni]
MTAVSVLLWLALLALLLYRFYLHNIKRPPNYPPGPPRIPLLEDYGLLLLINYRHLHRAAYRLARFYRTKVLGLSLAGVPTLVINDLAVAREVLTRREFDGRPNLFLALMREKHFKRRGVFFTDGPEWRDQRWFFLRYLRDYGFGKRSEQYELEVGYELQELVNVLKKGPQFEYERDYMRDGSVKCPDVFFVVLANALLQIFVGERYHRSKAEALVKASRKGLLFLRNGDDYGTIFSYFPWLRHVYPFTIKYRKIREGMLGLAQLMEIIVKRQQNTFDSGNPRNFVDLYLREMQRHVPQDDIFTFQFDQLVAGMADFYLPAVSGAAVQLSMLMERLLLQPNVARRIQQEIDDCVGTGRLPTLDDRINMPYTEATLREGLRIDTLVPSGIVHRTMQNATLQGYAIPENTLILTSLDRVNNQPEAWGDPETFRPERFLDDDGKIALSKDRSIPFGAGKRLCAGETYARNTMFLVLTTIVQNFDLQQRASDQLPDLSKRRTAFVTSPDDFWIKFVPR